MKCANNDVNGHTAKRNENKGRIVCMKMGRKRNQIEKKTLYGFDENSK